MYKVVEMFYDLQDGNHAYHPGDTFPRDGLKVTEERISELAGDKNALGKPLIEKVELRVERKRSRKYE
jgi:hypothetical protein